MHWLSSSAISTVRVDRHTKRSKKVIDCQQNGLIRNPAIADHEKHRITKWSGIRLPLIPTVKNELVKVCKVDWIHWIEIDISKKHYAVSFINTFSSQLSRNSATVSNRRIFLDLSTVSAPPRSRTWHQQAKNPTCLCFQSVFRCHCCLKLFFF